MRRLAALIALALLAPGCRGVGNRGPVGAPGTAAPAAAPAPAASPAPPTAPAAAAPAPPAPAAAPTAPAVPPSAAPATAEAGETTAIVASHCLTCHTEDLIRQQRLTESQWKKTLDKMHSWGSTIAPGRIEGLAAFLARRYGPEAGPYVAESRAARQVAELFEPRPVARYDGGDRARGATLYVDRCQPCHEEGGRGGEASVTIVGRGLYDRPAELAELVRAGRGDMPSFDETTDAEIADLLAWLRSLPAIAGESAAK